MVNHTGNADLSLVIKYADTNNKYKIRRVITDDEEKLKYMKKI